MKILEVTPKGNITHEMPRELWDEIRIFLILRRGKTIRQVLTALPVAVRRLVKSSRIRKTVPNGIQLKAVFIDEVVPKTP